MLLACDEGQDGLGVVVGLLLAGGARVLAVVGQLVHAAQVTDGVAEGSHGTDRVTRGPHKSQIWPDPRGLTAGYTETNN